MACGEQCQRCGYYEANHHDPDPKYDGCCDEFMPYEICPYCFEKELAEVGNKIACLRCNYVFHKETEQ